MTLGGRDICVPGSLEAGQKPLAVLHSSYMGKDVLNDLRVHQSTLCGSCILPGTPNMGRDHGLDLLAAARAKMPAA